ncbi:HNH endonuclease [Paenarthrobacter sp. NPDC089316]|uniref:HNH endonuclease n=1 Tax=unclassified Paenarthrobacter TaxID=2634190 RepID=UPI0034241016
MPGRRYAGRSVASLRCLLSKKGGGSDDARNGLPLCANHHLAFDRGYWCMDTDLKLPAQSHGPSLLDLAIPGTICPNCHFNRTQAISRVWAEWQATFHQG